LIAGYIDIILKRRQRKERFGDDGNEEEAMEEDLVTPGKNKLERSHLKLARTFTFENKIECLFTLKPNTFSLL
jgi:hypothetical protein